MTFDPNEVLDFDFVGVEPATFGDFRALPKGEYQLQCVGCTKYYTGESKGNPDPNKPNLLFDFRVINHPEYDGSEFIGAGNGLSHSLLPASKGFLLNTLMALVPEKDWQQGIKMPLSELISLVKGRPVNGVIDWEINAGSGKHTGKRFVNNRIKSLKPYDATIPPPKATEGNPPVISNNAANTSPVAQQAAAGVPQSEVDSFLSSIPGDAGTPATQSSSGFDFEPF